MIKYFTIEDLLKHYLQKKFHILAGKKGMLPWDAFLSFLPFYLVEYITRQVLPIFRTILQDGVRS